MLWILPQNISKPLRVPIAQIVHYNGRWETQYRTQNKHPKILYNKGILLLRMSTTLSSSSYDGFGSSTNKNF